MREVLSRPHLHELAVSSGFCKRNSKLSPEVFFDMLFYTVSYTEQNSLSYMVSLLKFGFWSYNKEAVVEQGSMTNSVRFVAITFH